MMATNVDDELRALGVRTEGSPLDKLEDFSAQLGGPDHKNKLWFFEAFRQYNVLPVRAELLPAPTAPAAPTTPSSVTSSTQVNVQANPANRFMVLYEWGQKFMPNRDISQFIRPEALVRAGRPPLGLPGQVRTRADRRRPAARR